VDGDRYTFDTLVRGYHEDQVFYTVMLGSGLQQIDPANPRGEALFYALVERAFTAAAESGAGEIATGQIDHEADEDAAQSNEEPDEEAEQERPFDAELGPETQLETAEPEPELVELDLEAEVEAEPVAEEPEPAVVAEPEPDLEPDEPTEETPAPTRKKQKRKKISFV
jgi:outer membrane biosynthesis protein TonB